MKSPSIFLCALLCSLIGSRGFVLKDDANGNQTEPVIATTEEGSSSDIFGHYSNETDTLPHENDTYSYDGDSDGNEEYYVEYKVGESNYETVEEDDNLTTMSAEVANQVDDDNCMKVDSYLMTEELENCCVVLEANLTTSNYSVNEIERCTLLQLFHLYGLTSEVNVEDQVTMRRFYGPTCTIITNYSMMSNLCCLHPKCEQYTHMVLKSMCLACSESCPTCGARLLH